MSTILEIFNKARPLFLSGGLPCAAFLWIKKFYPEIEVGNHDTLNSMSEVMFSAFMLVEQKEGYIYRKTIFNEAFCAFLFLDFWYISSWCFLIQKK